MALICIIKLIYTLSINKWVVQWPLQTRIILIVLISTITITHALNNSFYNVLHRFITFYIFITIYAIQHILLFNYPGGSKNTVLKCTSAINRSQPQYPFSNAPLYLFPIAGSSQPTNSTRGANANVSLWCRPVLWSAATRTPATSFSSTGVLQLSLVRRRGQTEMSARVRRDAVWPPASSSTSHAFLHEASIGGFLLKFYTKQLDRAPFDGNEDTKSWRGTTYKWELDTDNDVTWRREHRSDHIGSANQVPATDSDPRRPHKWWQLFL